MIKLKCTTIFVFILLTIICVKEVSAQKFNGGLLAGLNTSQIDGDRFGGYDKAGFIAGGFVNYYLHKYSGLQMELYYIQKGAGKKQDETNTTFYKVKVNYFELPVLYFYEASDRLLFEAGASYAILVKGTEDFGAGDIKPVDDPFNPNDFSVLGSVGYHINDNLFVHIRYSHSVLPIRNHPGDQTYFLNRGQYNNCLTFTLRYLINE